MKTSVKNLCEFAAKQGDINYRFTPSPSAEQGIIAHKLLQKKRGASYQAEYALSNNIWGLQVSGRADGYDAKHNFVEEIKSHRGSVEGISENQKQFHWAQLKCYAAMLCFEARIETIELKLVYFNIDTSKETCLVKTAHASTLEQYYSQLCLSFVWWTVQIDRHRQQRNQQLLSLKFPFHQFRDGQRQLSEFVYQCAAQSSTALLQAPTGLGKTMGVLYPALMSMPRYNLDRIHFLSCRNTGKSVALDALAKLHEQSDIWTIELTAKNHSCVHPEFSCQGSSCPLANGFFDRLPSARQALVQESKIWSREFLDEHAAVYDICPYYFTQEMSKWADVIVADVNHMYDQQAGLASQLKSEGSDSLCLVDEAHNLIDRARDMYSATLHQSIFNALQSTAPASIAKPLRRVISAWREINRKLANKEQPNQFIDYVPETLDGPLTGLCSAISDYATQHPLSKETQELLFDSLNFSKLAQEFNEHSVCEYIWQARGKATLSIRNQIPGDHLAQRYDLCRSTILFSATLSPYSYYKDLLGLPEQTLWRQIQSPFKASQLDLRIVTDISTRWKNRSHSLVPICERIARQFENSPGNYLVFASSFAYLEDIQQCLKLNFPDIKQQVQNRRMNNQQRQVFLDSFKTDTQQIGFAVLGGVFSEGIDLSGERLIGAFICTLGLAPFDPQSEVLRSRLEQRYQQGYNYTYLYPGLRKVIQAAGRVIRDGNDRGIVELIDERFGRPDIQALFPDWWLIKPT